MNNDTFQGAINLGQFQASVGGPLQVPYGSSNEFRMAQENAYNFFKNGS